MSNVYQLVNNGIGLEHGRRMWIQLGQPLAVGPKRVYRLMCDVVDGEYIPIFAEEIHNHLLKNHVIGDGYWLCEPVASGHLEIIPKAMRYDAVGRVDAVLVELLLTPADMAFSSLFPIVF